MQAEKRYVTHLLHETGERLWRLLGEEGAHLYVCGDAKMMAKDVRNIVREICQVQHRYLYMDLKLCAGKANLHVRGNFMSMAKATGTYRLKFPVSQTPGSRESLVSQTPGSLFF